jgi:ribonuclease HI
VPDIIDENAINIYTDGSSYTGPRRGGMGIVFVTVNDEGHEVVEEHQPLGHRGATNTSDGTSSVH